MNLSSTPRAPESALRKEARIFRQQLGRLIDCALNRVFDLTERGARRRRRMLFFLLPLLGILFLLLSAREWATQFTRFFAYLLSSEYRALAPADTLPQFFLFLGDALFGPETPRILPLVILSFVIAREAAANYLDDIFELGQVDIARDFILQVALTGNRKHIRIREGQIHPEDIDSPIYRIGGPGQVEVELDSVALFEKPDGRPRVIGPTVDGKATLEGFERLRQAIDLRDQYPNPLEVAGRSLDGIPVSTVDVRMLYSIWRKDQPASIEHPHPFDREAVKTLVYEQVSRVNVRDQNPSDVEETWAGTITTLIRGELGKFIGGRRLVEYLASIGPPEVQQAREREVVIQAAGKAVIPEEDALQPRPVPPPPDFQARPRVSNLFGEFTTGFTEKASKRGVELHWVGVGTWRTPSEIVPEKHLEAWRLSCENLARSSPTALEELKEGARLQQLTRLVQSVPLAHFQKNGDLPRVRGLLVAYRQQLIEAEALLRKSNKEVSRWIPRAIDYIGKVIGHWVGDTNTPSS
jgi:hypothetical protein